MPNFRRLLRVSIVALTTSLIVNRAFNEDDDSTAPEDDNDRGYRWTKRGVQKGVQGYLNKEDRT